MQIPLDVESLVEMSRTALSSFAAEVGLLVAQRLLEDEVTQHCGERHERQTEREMTRYGHQGGYVTLAGQKGRIQKPRVRNLKSGGEVELERYRLLQSADAMPQAALNRLVNGVSTRRYWSSAGAWCQASATSPSASALATGPRSPTTPPSCGGHGYSRRRVTEFRTVSIVSSLQPVPGRRRIVRGACEE